MSDAIAIIQSEMDRGTPYGREFAKLIADMERVADSRAARCGRDVRNSDDVAYARRVYARRRDTVAALWVPAD